ncbi:MAG: Crp/Fnr family transcriptional regulator [Firmicutes bacterium HGW-Firmicutes-7]|nr:MAG: Crp/Fnr family transcriptional regulator [Firmicutes bacterium HGW-Firmicutes-7]
MDIKSDLSSYSLQPRAARNLSNSTKSKPIMESITPRWLLNFLPWISVEAGIYRVNKRKNYNLLSTSNYPKPNEVLTDDTRQLSDIPPFKYMHPEAINTITPHLTKEQFDAGTTVTKAGIEGDKLYIVTKGKIEVTTTGPRGEVINIGILADGDFSDMDAFIQKSNRLVNITAITPSILYSINRDAFENWLASSPKDVLDQFNHANDLWDQTRMESNESGERSINVYSGSLGETDIPLTYPDYDETPKEYVLNIVQTILRINSQITDIFNQPINQLEEQMRLTVEAMLERQEWEIINNKEFGLLNSISPKMSIRSKNSVPTPDALDELLIRVWKKPAFFLAHPQAIAAFGRECTRRGVPPVAINIDGSPFITWRGVPLVPCDKLLINGKKNSYSCGTTNILLLRVGEEEQGVIGLHQPGIPDEKYMPSLSVKNGGIDVNGITSYILRLYYSAAVLAEDALGVLQDVEVGYYHDYE